jgi:hypothetical protein
LAATPRCGGHYFVDVFADIAIAAAGTAARAIAGYLTRAPAASGAAEAWLPASMPAK